MINKTQNVIKTKYIIIIKLFTLCICVDFSGKKQSDTNNSVHYSADQQQELLSPTSTNNSVHNSADQQQELVSSTSVR